MPWFKHFDKEWIDKYVAIFRKVVENYEQLLDNASDTPDEDVGGRWYGTENK